jgi:hypothetical protein
MSTKNGAIDPRPARTMSRILELLKAGPLTNLELAEKLSLPRITVYWNLCRLLDAPRQVHVSGWKRTGGKPFRQFALGDMPDVPFEPLHTITKPKQGMTDINCAVLVDALARPQSVADLVESCHCSAAYVHKYLAILMRETPRRIYIKEWRRPEGPGGLAPVYAAGSKLDVVKPRITQADRFQELKADKERHERALKLRQLSAARRRTRKKPQNVFSALGL